MMEFEWIDTSGGRKEYYRAHFGVFHAVAYLTVDGQWYGDVVIHGAHLPVIRDTAREVMEWCTDLAINRLSSWYARASTMKVPET